MKIITRFCCLLVALFCLLAPLPLQAGNKAEVEVLYMNHGPMQPTLRQLRALFARHQEQLQVHWYDFEKRAGKKFMAKKKLHGHIPLLIMVNGQSSHRLAGREVTFKGFPTGAAPFKAVEGKWAIADLQALIEQLTAGR